MMCLPYLLHDCDFCSPSPHMHAAKRLGRARACLLYTHDQALQNTGTRSLARDCRARLLPIGACFWIQIDM